MKLSSKTSKYTPNLIEVDQGYESPTTFRRQASASAALGIASFVALKTDHRITATLLGLGSAYRAMGALDVLTTPDL